MSRFNWMRGMMALLVVSAFGSTHLSAQAVTPQENTPQAVVIPKPVLELSAALKMREVMQVLREEGMASGAELASDLPRGATDPLWSAALSRIYDPAQMEVAFNESFARSLADEGATVEAATAFFASPIGERALSLELAARKALQDEAVEAAAERAYADLAVSNPERLALIDDFVAVNDLVESNVMGALNANLAFLRGLAGSGDKTFALPEADMLAQVWAAEPEVRAEMVAWVYPFLTLAYQPLSDAELSAYLAFSETQAGQQVNAAMFQAYDALFEGISRDLGRAFGLAMQGDDI
ncbi:MAG: hypothetical protein ACO22Z_02560 [Paracoccaceae bacterium]